jgi:hypothetical protein
MPQEPWHFTTWLDALDHWQALIAGLIALIAAAVAPWGTEHYSREKERREVDAMRAALIVEVRGYFRQLITTRGMLSSLPSEAIPAGDLKALVHLPSPLIYGASATKIGFLGPLASDLTASIRYWICSIF